jgi:hypothetical protein
MKACSIALVLGLVAWLVLTERVHARALPTWDRVLPAAGRFKLVMGDEAVLDQEGRVPAACG